MNLLNNQNWSIRRRLYVVAITACFCTLVSVGVNYFTVRNYEHNLEHISQGELSRLYQISHSFREMSDVHSSLFNLLRFAGKKRTEQQVYVMGGKLIDRIDKLDNYLHENHDKVPTGKDGKPYTSRFHVVREELATYRNAASISIEMLTVNPQLSEKYMLKATTTFNRLNSLLAINISDISEHIHHELAEEVELINQIYWPLSVAIIIIAGLMAPLVVKIIRDLTSKFHRIETTLEDLRNGNTDITIPDTAPDSEMFKVNKSLQEFKTALINLRDSKNALSENNRLLIEESERRILTEKELRRSLIELSNAIDAAETSNKAKSLFLANMSHEIRTPLNAVLGMAQLLQTTELDESQEDYVDTLYKQGRHLLQLLNSVLDYSRIESGKLILKHEPFQLDKLLDEVSSLFIADHEHSNIRLSIDIDSDVDNNLNGDPLRIRQILINLLSNAYKFTEQGEVRVHVQNNPSKSNCQQQRPEQCPNTSVSSHCDRPSLYITVSDTGIGIAKDKQSYIFETFTQSDESHTREYGGTGIGLAICKQLVEIMDGEIGVNSKIGEGATFWFRICLPTMACIENSQSA